MDKLPLELIPNLFIQSLPPIRCHDGDSRIFESHFIVSRFSLVCRYWRDRILATPEMWTDIEIGDNTKLARTNMRLERARDRPLHLSIYMDDTRTPKEMKLSLKAVCAKVQQWSTLQVHGAEICEDDLKLFLPASLPNLTDLVIANAFEPALFETYHIAPKLQRLMLGGEGDHTMTFSATPALRHCAITEFVRSHRFRQWHDFIMDLAEKCPRLEVLEVRTTELPDIDFGTDPMEELPWPPLPNLKKVIFRGCNNQTIPYVLAHINAPALEIVHLSQLGYCHELQEPISLPCKTIIDRSQFRTIRRFVSKVTNAQSAVMSVDFVDALHLLMVEPSDRQKEKFAIEGSEYLPHLLIHFAWFAANTNVEWTLPRGVRVSGSAPDATNQAMEGFWAYTAWIGLQITGEWTPKAIGNALTFFRFLHRQPRIRNVQRNSTSSRYRPSIRRTSEPASRRSSCRST